MVKMILFLLLQFLCEVDENIPEEKNNTLLYIFIGSGVALIFILGIIIVIIHFRRRRISLIQDQLSDVDLNIKDDEQLRKKIRFGK